MTTHALVHRPFRARHAAVVLALLTLAGREARAGSFPLVLSDDSASVCTGVGPRWIGTDDVAGACDDPADCPCPEAPAGWAVKRAFEVTPAGADAPARLPPLLAPYCSYTWEVDRPVNDQDVKGLKDKLTGHVDGLSEDCVVIAPHGHPLHDSVRPWMQKQFRDAAGGSDALPRGTLNPADVEIAVLDTSPDDAGGGIPAGRLEHGRLVGWLGRDLTCDDPSAPSSCFGQVSTWLALPYVDEQTVDRTNGGSFGTRAELARQLVMAVETWKLRSATRPRLVIPLALGWDPQFGPASDTASQAVRQAILHATCHGALVIAAAGNHTGGPTPGHGQLLPAAWEADTAPSAAECEALEGVSSLANMMPSYPYTILPGAAPATPLVLSIAGVDHAGLPIALTRPGSVSRFAALGFQAIAGDPAEELPAPHTGTSIAAAVAGAAAASAWAYDPSLTAPDVVALLAQSAKPISSFEKEHCLDEKCKVRLLSVPAARAAACEGATGNPRCPDPALGLAWSAPELHEMEWPTTLRADLASYFEGIPLTSTKLTDGSPFDLERSAAVPAWTYPQPLQPGCSVCAFQRGSGSLDVEISPSYPCTIYNVTLRVFEGRGVTNVLVATSMSPGAMLRASLGAAYEGATGAVLAWSLGGSGTSATEQVTLF